MTHSTLDVGLVSLAQLGPLLLGSFGGGRDRRRLQPPAAARRHAGPARRDEPRPRPQRPLGPAGPVGGVRLQRRRGGGCRRRRPDARRRSSPTSSRRASLTQAMALWQLMFSLNIVVGPALAGVLDRPVRPRVRLLGRPRDLRRLARQPSCGSRSPRPAVRAACSHPAAFVEGLRYLARHQVLQAVYLVDLNAMVFGMPRALFPALAVLRFHGGAETVGLLYAAPGRGALLGAVPCRLGDDDPPPGARRPRRRGGLGGSPSPPSGSRRRSCSPSCCSALAGAADVISAVFRSTILQLEAPDALRGRLQAVQTAVVTGGPRLGDLESGAVAAAIGVANSVIAGGADVPRRRRGPRPAHAAFRIVRRAHAGASGRPRPAGAMWKGRAMKVGIVGGTGPAGRALGARLAAAGATVVLGSRDADAGRGSGRRGDHRPLARIRPRDRRRGERGGGGGGHRRAGDRVGRRRRRRRFSSRRELAGRVVVSMANAITRVGGEFQALVPGARLPRRDGPGRRARLPGGRRLPAPPGGAARPARPADRGRRARLRRRRRGR